MWNVFHHSQLGEGEKTATSRGDNIHLVLLVHWRAQGIECIVYPLPTLPSALKKCQHMSKSVSGSSVSQEGSTESGMQMSDGKQKVRQGILASNRQPGEGPSEKMNVFKVDSAGKRRLWYCCHRAKPWGLRMESRV